MFEQGTFARAVPGGWFAIACALSLIALVSLLPVRGLWLLYTDHGVDMQTRWQEVQYLLRGVDPVTRFGSAGASAGEIGFPDLAIPGRDAPQAVYPPWSYVMSVPLLLPGTLPAATVWFVALNACLLAGLLVWALRHGWTSSGPVFALGCALALLALDGVGRTFTVGNYGVVVLALLVGSLITVERGRTVLAGALFGLALLKPTLAGPFVFPLAMIAWREDSSRGVWRVVATATAVVVGASLVFWWMTGTDPLTSLWETQARLPYFVTDGGGSTTVWRNHLPLPRIMIGGFSLELAQYGGMLLSLGVGALAAIALRRAAALEQFGIASVVAMTWTYHRPYDSLLLIFLLLALARYARPGESVGTRCVAIPTLLATGVTLWLPSRYIGWPDSTLLLQAIWVVAGLVLVLLSRRRASGEASPAQ